MRMPFTIIAIAGIVLGAHSQDATFTFDDSDSIAQLLPMPEGVNVVWDAGALKIVSRGEEMSIPLVRVPMDGVEAPYVYRARIKGEGLAGPAYLEMWSEFDTGRYFSRALDDSIRGDRDWIASSTPFHLKKGDPHLQSVTLGIRMEGPGTMWIDDIALEPMAPMRGLLNSAGSRPWILVWSIAGAVFGIVVGTWGALVGHCAQRGIARQALIPTGYALLVGSIIALVYGTVVAVHGLWAVGHFPFEHAYPPLLLGIIGSIVMPNVLRVTRQRYRDAELRRMQAMDVT